MVTAVRGQRCVFALHHWVGWFGGRGRQWEKIPEVNEEMLLITDIKLLFAISLGGRMQKSFSLIESVEEERRTGGKTVLHQSWVYSSILCLWNRILPSPSVHLKRSMLGSFVLTRTGRFLRGLHLWKTKHEDRLEYDHNTALLLDLNKDVPCQWFYLWFLWTDEYWGWVWWLQDSTSSPDFCFQEFKASP